jgi:hypothetical protein
MVMEAVGLFGHDHGTHGHGDLRLVLHGILPPQSWRLTGHGGVDFFSFNFI